jgi:outer membrane protein
MSKIFYSIILLLFSLPSLSQEKIFTLQNCIDSAIKNNIEVRQGRLLANVASVNYNQSKANVLPDVNGLVSQGINRGRSIDPFTNTYVDQKISYGNYALGAGLVLFNGFNVRNTIRQSAYAYDAAKLEWQQLKDELTLDVILAYLQVLNNEDILEVARQQVSVSRQQLDRLEKLNKQGAINPPQLHEIRGQLKGNELTVIDNQNALEISKLNLLQLMNIPYNAGLRLERKGVEEVIIPPAGETEDLYNKALNHLSGVKAAQLRKKSADAFIKASKGRMFPTLSFNGNLNTNYSSIATRELLTGTSDVPTSNYVIINGSQVPVIAKQNSYTSNKISYGSQLNNNIFSNFGLTLRIPVLNSFEARNQVKLAKIEYESRMLLEENVRIQLRQQIEQAHLLLMNSFNRYVVLKEQEEAFREAFRAAEVRFNAGVGSSIDYILAKNNYDRANLNLVTGRYDYLLRRQVVNYFTGTND